MIRLIVFDLDSTLAELGKGIARENLEILYKLEKAGIRLAVCSGKTCDYLCGFFRQLELKSPIIIGENGAALRMGVDLPPKQEYVLEYSKEARDSLAYIKKKIEECCPGIWYQPNLVGVTPFPRSEEEFVKIENCIAESRECLKDVEIYRHEDSFDIVPEGICKSAGVALLMELLGLSPEEVMAVGNGENDYSMFALAGTAIGVHVEDADKVTRNCESTDEMFAYLKEILLLKEK